jgi:hypothetical protein
VLLAAGDAVYTAQFGGQMFRPLKTEKKVINNVPGTVREY